MAPNAIVGDSDVERVRVVSDQPASNPYSATVVLTSSVSTLGVDFNPANQTGAGDYGRVVTRTIQLVNKSGITNDFTMRRSPTQWRTNIWPPEVTGLAPDASA